MHGTRILYLDQYGGRWFASTVRDLQRQIGGRVSRMFIDRNGESFHIGYVVGQLWCTAFQPVERKA